VDGPKTHYQLSFTVRQALALFFALLLALTVAYFFGVMTGLAGRRQEGARASVPSPTAVQALPGGGGQETSGVASMAAAEPTPPGKIQLFEDRSGEEVTPPGARRAATPARPPTAPFWVQVASVRSEREARAESRRLSSRGYHATVEAVSGPKGNLYRVRVGPYRTREEASRAAERVSRHEKVKAWIVPAGK
jgi:cell division septation protein DedD